MKIRSRVVCLAIALVALFSWGACAQKELKQSDSDQITLAFDRESPKYASCFQEHGEKKAGTVRVKYWLDSNGRFTKLEAVRGGGESTLYSEALYQCIENALVLVDPRVRPGITVQGDYSIRFSAPVVVNLPSASKPASAGKAEAPPRKKTLKP